MRTILLLALCVLPLLAAFPSDHDQSALTEVDGFDESLAQLGKILSLVRRDVTAHSENSTALIGVINNVNQTLLLAQEQRSNLPTLLVTVMSAREVSETLVQAYVTLESAEPNTVNTITRCIDSDSIAALDNSTSCVNGQLRAAGVPPESDGSLLSSLSQSFSFSSLSLPAIVACVSDQRFANFVQSVQVCVEANAQSASNSTANPWSKANTLLASLSQAKSPLDPYMSKFKNVPKKISIPPAPAAASSNAHGSRPSASEATPSSPITSNSNVAEGESEGQVKAV